MPRGECIISGCTRAAQVKGALKGYCCSLCGVTDPTRHAVICDMVEEAGKAELEIQDNIILGYD